MTLDKFTIKAQEAIQEAVNAASSGGQQVIEPVHLLKGVMAKAKDVANFIFQKLGVNASQIEMLTEQEIKHLPRVEGGQPYLSNDSNRVLQQAIDLSGKMGFDEKGDRVGDFYRIYKVNNAGKFELQAR